MNELKLFKRMLSVGSKSLDTISNHSKRIPRLFTKENRGTTLAVFSILLACYLSYFNGFSLPWQRSRVKIVSVSADNNITIVSMIDKTSYYKVNGIVRNAIKLGNSKIIAGINVEAKPPGGYLLLLDAHARVIDSTSLVDWMDTTLNQKNKRWEVKAILVANNTGINSTPTATAHIESQSFSNYYRQHLNVLVELEYRNDSLRPLRWMLQAGSGEYLQVSENSEINEYMFYGHTNNKDLWKRMRPPKVDDDSTLWTYAPDPGEAFDTLAAEQYMENNIPLCIYRFRFAQEGDDDKMINININSNNFIDLIWFTLFPTLRQGSGPTITLYESYFDNAVMTSDALMQIDLYYIENSGGEIGKQWGTFDIDVRNGTIIDTIMNKRTNYYLHKPNVIRDSDNIDLFK